ncbi:MAG: class I SAM-dependent methyltransferase [Dehalococcoidales bacterium]|nr:class I SAM-dependent methyltransferase [Dehalococcoidales bacterium]
MPTQKAKNNPGIQSRLDYKIMSLGFKIRDAFKPRSRILEEVGIKKGHKVLDYGCGPGGYVIPVTKSIGDSGVLYALDIHPLAVESVQTLISKKGLANVEVICSDCETGLADESVDVVLLYDILHHLENRDEVLSELHRVLKSEGVLSVTDHHLNEENIISEITSGGLFNLSVKGKMTCSFVK